MKRHNILKQYPEHKKMNGPVKIENYQDLISWHLW